MIFELHKATKFIRRAKTQIQCTVSFVQDDKNKWSTYNTVEANYISLLIVSTPRQGQHDTITNYSAPMCLLFWSEKIPGNDNQSQITSLCC
jgi:hypothetical protein